MRLLLPGWEGNTNVKWLHRLKATAGPAMTRDETSKYSDRMPDGHSLLFTFPLGVKSVITSPSPGLKLDKPGIYQISGIAWSGEGKVRSVEVSADGGKSWGKAMLEGHVLPKCLTRFRVPWRWSGQPGVLMSRAVDEKGRVQPTRTAVLAARGPGMTYHNNAIQAWRVNEAGSVENVHA
jgi:sulfane dehydrogenase subunit SoxC